ncbi:sulfite oxidase [Streptomyces sp. IMTB 2501]|uniref:molybdopterin-dependent oxidoreductase n=1 Tax=Streptomyces sp. IMTB 2501 TaxID=1776340 RepID=UPI00096D1C27|nr:molybdopterin-dependent oxidoreductase [Streptomyces sp. IMTB 2501]OLZ74569.1 sulfite oxidase [Streptomyces sp. IMTB 2501]
MGQRSGDPSTPARPAAPDEGIGAGELTLATRNHGLPLEALRHDVTPPGLHYVLTHYDIPYVPNAGAWRLAVDGQVCVPLDLSLADLLSFPQVTTRVTLECAGNGRALLTPRPLGQPWLVEAVGTADWTGVPLRLLLAEAGADPAAVDVVFTGADHGVERGIEQDYRRALPLAVALGDDPQVLVATAMNGAPLPPQHGRPLRLIVPGWYGMAHVKWLRSVTVSARPFTGFQQTVAYRVRRAADEEGEPVTRIAPRALLVPPGFPDFMSRTRVVRPGRVRLFGRAWSGQAPVSSVEVSTDSGASWAPAVLAPAMDGQRWAWRGWHHDWAPAPGEYGVGARATDSAGSTQPLEQCWNRGGFANNAVCFVQVVCVGDGSSP